MENLVALFGADKHLEPTLLQLLKTLVQKSQLITDRNKIATLLANMIYKKQTSYGNTKVSLEEYERKCRELLWRVMQSAVRCEDAVMRILSHMTPDVVFRKPGKFPRIS